MPDRALSPVGELLRRRDPDRFFTALFAPAADRDALFTLYAFAGELGRSADSGRERIAALIRLQWWREVLEGARRHHEVAGPLGLALDEGRLDPAELLAMVEAWEEEVESDRPDRPLPSPETVRATSGATMVAAARLLGMDGAEDLRDWGAAYGASRILQVAEPATREAGSGPTLRSAMTGWLSRRVSVPRVALSAALPVVIARRRLTGRMGRGGDRVATLLAALVGRC